MSGYSGLPVSQVLGFLSLSPEQCSFRIAGNAVFQILSIRLSGSLTRIRNGGMRRAAALRRALIAYFVRALVRNRPTDIPMASSRAETARTQVAGSGASSVSKNVGASFPPISFEPGLRAMPLMLLAVSEKCRGCNIEGAIAAIRTFVPLQGRVRYLPPQYHRRSSSRYREHCSWCRGRYLTPSLRRRLAMRSGH